MKCHFFGEKKRQKKSGIFECMHRRLIKKNVGGISTFFEFFYHLSLHSLKLYGVKHWYKYNFGVENILMNN